MVDKIKNDSIVDKQLPYNISDVKSGNFELISLFQAESFQAPLVINKQELKILKSDKLNEIDK